MSRILLAATLLATAAPPAAGQVGFEAQYGRWWHDDRATTFSAGVYGPLLGPFSWSFGVMHVDDHLAPLDRTQTGASLSLALFRDGHGAYGVVSTAAGVRHAGANMDLHWSAGLGYARTFLGATIAIEGRYRWEDAGWAGFWQLDPADRRGWGLEGRISFPLAGRRSATGAGPGSPADRPVARPADVDRFVRAGGASGNAAATTSAVVRTALDVMGTPYQWGGTDDNGFDCSGLIQYAYGEHGIILPRVSRDQMRQGIAVSTEVETLRPGDLLGFSVEGRGISHIGLYVGDGQFIHSSSRGVTVTSLTDGDPDSAYWLRRWVAVRRIVE